MSAVGSSVSQSSIGVCAAAHARTRRHRLSVCVTHNSSHLTCAGEWAVWAVATLWRLSTLKSEN